MVQVTRASQEGGMTVDLYFPPLPPHLSLSLSLSLPLSLSLSLSLVAAAAAVEDMGRHAGAAYSPAALDAFRKRLRNRRRVVIFSRSRARLQTLTHTFTLTRAGNIMSPTLSRAQSLSTLCKLSQGNAGSGLKDIDVFSVLNKEGEEGREKKGEEIYTACLSHRHICVIILHGAGQWIRKDVCVCVCVCVCERGEA